MAVTGIVFILFVLAHMYGNLRAFWGADAYNTYSGELRTIFTPELPEHGFLYIMEAVLSACVVIHAYCAVVLWRRASGARPVRYQVKRNRHSSLSSRTMRYGGITLLLFIVWHILEFTNPRISITGDATNNPYQLTVDTFQVWWMTVIYLLAMLALGLHLHHGTWSAAETLGWTSTARARRNAKTLGWVLAVVIAGGFALVPFFIAIRVIQ